MRLTKMVIKKAKEGLSNRIKEIYSMDAEQVSEEYQKCFPAGEEVWTKHQMESLIMLALDQCVPDHWLD